MIPVRSQWGHYNLPRSYDRFKWCCNKHVPDRVHPGSFMLILQLPPVVDHHWGKTSQQPEASTGPGNSWVPLPKARKTGWWFEPLWQIWKSVGIIIPNTWKVVKFMFQTTKPQIYESVGMIPKIWKNKSHVPNHQPEEATTATKVKKPKS